MMKTPEHSKRLMMSFRWMLSLTIHNKGSGMQTMTKSVLGQISIVPQRASYPCYLREVENSESDIVGDSKSTLVWNRS